MATPRHTSDDRILPLRKSLLHNPVTETPSTRAGAGDWEGANRAYGTKLGLPLVSIIVPLYNGKSMIRQLLTSILGNSYKNIEVIVIDDASTDGGSSILKEEFPWVRVLVNEVNEG